MLLLIFNQVILKVRIAKFHNVIRIVEHLDITYLGVGQIRITLVFANLYPRASNCPIAF